MNVNLGDRKCNCLAKVRSANQKLIFGHGTAKLTFKFSSTDFDDLTPVLSDFADFRAEMNVTIYLQTSIKFSM